MKDSPTISSPSSQEDLSQSESMERKGGTSSSSSASPSKQTRLDKRRTSSPPSKNYKRSLSQQEHHNDSDPFAVETNCSHNDYEGVFDEEKFHRFSPYSGIMTDSNNLRSNSISTSAPTNFSILNNHRKPSFTNMINRNPIHGLGTDFYANSLRRQEFPYQQRMNFQRNAFNISEDMNSLKLHNNIISESKLESMSSSDTSSVGTTSTCCSSNSSLRVSWCNLTYVVEGQSNKESFIQSASASSLTNPCNKKANQRDRKSVV